MANDEICAIVGVGPGLGGSLARRFASEGHRVALMARRRNNVDPVGEAIEGAGGRALSISCDAGDPSSVSAAFTTVRSELGDPSVLIYNAGAFDVGEVLDIDPDTFERAWRANCYGAFLAAKEVLPRMLERGRGTILLTGATAARRGSAKFSAFAVGKFGLRALAQSLAREYGPRGVHTVHVVIDGQIDAPQSRRMFPDRGDEAFLAPGAIADVYWNLHVQHPTTWTMELDLRPSVEPF